MQRWTCILSCFSHVQIFATLQTVAHQDASLHGTSQKNTGVGSFCRNLPDRGSSPTSLMSPALVGEFFTTKHLVSPKKKRTGVFLGVEGRDRKSVEAVGRQCTEIAPPYSKELVAAAMNSSLLEAVEKKANTHQKREPLGPFVASRTTFWFQFLSLSGNRSIPTWQLHDSLESYHNHGLFQTALGDSCYFHYACFMCA